MSGEGVVILSAVRTPIGNFCGKLSTLKAHELGGMAMSECIKRSGVTPEDVDEVIFGHVLTAGQGQNPVRQASVMAGIPHSCPATSINMVCGSGLRSAVIGTQSIRLGDAQVVMAGGQESMSRAQHSVPMRNFKMGNATLSDTMLTDGLTDAFGNGHMGLTAENVAKKWQISREHQDIFSYQSQMKAANAIQNGSFKGQIVPITIKNWSGSTVIDEDEFPKPKTTLEGLQGLKPAFIKDGTGTVTAGNASGINDGAAAILLCSEKLSTMRGLKPLAKVVSHAYTGCDPAYMGIGPIAAVKAAVKKANWNINDVDIFELNEAFASQSLAVVRDLGINPDKVNINGGSIALGHPIGASGARILVTLIHAMKDNGHKKGVAALCIGGGMGIAMCVEAC